MIEHGHTVVAASPPLQADTVWVLARHLLVAQALAAALGGRIEDVRALAWDGRTADLSHIDAVRDFLLVVDDGGTPADLARVRALLPRAPSRTLVMTAAPKGEGWGALLSAGAAEVVTQPRSIEELTEVMARVSAGEPMITADERSELCQRWVRHLAEDQAILQRMNTLSAQELLVLHGLASGRRPAEIGVDLGVSSSTVRTHVRSIRSKLEVRSQLQAVLVVHRLRSRVPVSGPDLPAPRPARE